MLIEFSIGNYLSFKDTVTLSMVTAPIKEHKENNVFSANKFELLKSAAIYGANASGKSNLFKAMKYMKNLVFNSSKESQATEPIDVENYRLSTETEDKSSFFEIVFIYEGIRYRYGFEIDKTKVCSEWLFYVPTIKEARLFYREENNIEVGAHFKEGKELEDKTRNNALFLSVVAQFNGEISQKILKWFVNFNIISGLDDTGYKAFTMSKLQDDDFKAKILEFLKIADLYINDVYIKRTKLSDYASSFKKPGELRKLLDKLEGDEIVEVATLHKKYDKDNKFVSFKEFRMDEQESKGTEKLFALSGPIISTLQYGKILVIDELDARLHPAMTNFIIKLFNSDKNTSNAQLIFATHDTNLLTNELFRRDQIWFTEKDRYGATDLYSLIEYKNVRKDASFEKNYILGIYGGIPIVGFSENLFEVKNG